MSAKPQKPDTEEQRRDRCAEERRAIDVLVEAGLLEFAERRRIDIRWRGRWSSVLDPRTFLDVPIHAPDCGCSECPPSEAPWSEVSTGEPWKESE